MRLALLLTILLVAFGDTSNAKEKEPDNQTKLLKENQKRIIKLMEQTEDARVTLKKLNKRLRNVQTDLTQFRFPSWLTILVPVIAVVITAVFGYRAAQRTTELQINDKQAARLFDAIEWFKTDDPHHRSLGLAVIEDNWGKAPARRNLWTSILADQAVLVIGKTTDARKTEASNERRIQKLLKKGNVTPHQRERIEKAIGKLRGADKQAWQDAIE